MKKLILLALALAFALVSTAAEAKHRKKKHRHHHHVHRVVGVQVAALGNVGLFAATASNGLVRASSGRTARVNPQYASRFQCLVRGLEAAGYKIDFMGGYRHSKIAGTNRWSKHASGRAIDINQTGRNRVTRRLPHGATAIASACGLLHGAVWRHADAGHFEVP